MDPPNSKCSLFLYYTPTSICFLFLFSIGFDLNLEPPTDGLDSNLEPQAAATRKCS
jgi:hypothetical protein